MPNWAWFIAGILATHLFWAVVLVGWWAIILKNSDPHEREAFDRDILEIRARIGESIARARQAGRN